MLAHRKRELDPRGRGRVQLGAVAKDIDRAGGLVGRPARLTPQDLEQAPESVLLTVGRSDAGTERIPRVVDEQSLQGEGCGPPSLMGLSVQPPGGLEDGTRLQVVEDRGSETRWQSFAGHL